ncbi:hypothetical protein D3C72_1413470 [compost metagenome]
MRGWKRRILAPLLYCVADSGYSTIFSSTTRPTMAQPQLPTSLCTWLSTQNRPWPITAIIEKRL